MTLLSPLTIDEIACTYGEGIDDQLDILRFFDYCRRSNITPPRIFIEMVRRDVDGYDPEEDEYGDDAEEFLLDECVNWPDVSHFANLHSRLSRGLSYIRNRVDYKTQSLQTEDSAEANQFPFWFGGIPILGQFNAQFMCSTKPTAETLLLDCESFSQSKFYLRLGLSAIYAEECLGGCFGVDLFSLDNNEFIRVEKVHRKYAEEAIDHIRKLHDLKAVYLNKLAS